jgi:cell wall-associated NlpC family hydrolase
MPSGILRGRALRPAALILFCILSLLGSASDLDAQSFPYLRTLLSGPRTVTADIVREDMVRDSIVALARQQIGTPYRLGATSPERGFDCSGLVVYVMNQLGISLPRTAALQARVGQEVVRDRGQLRPGDLLTFGRGSRISHVGIYIGNGRYIHASSGRGEVTETVVPTSTWWRGVRRLPLIMAVDMRRSEDES